MASLTNRDKLLLIVVVMGVGILLWNFLKPPTIPANQGALLPLDKATQQFGLNKLKYAQLRASEDEMRPQIARMSYNLPAEQLVPRVTQDLMEIANKAGVHLREIKPLRVRSMPSGSVARVPLEVRFSAPFQPNVVRFLYYVETPDGKMVVDKMNVTSADARFKSVDVSADITVFTRAAAGIAGAEKGDTNDTNEKANRS